MAAVLSVSNLYFWRTTNYFSDQSNPLLHTRSLGVEEQFYIVIPLLLMLIFRRRQTKCMDDVFAAQEAGVRSAMR